MQYRFFTALSRTLGVHCYERFNYCRSCKLRQYQCFLVTYFLSRPLIVCTICFFSKVLVGAWVDVREASSVDKRSFWAAF